MRRLIIGSSVVSSCQMRAIPDEERGKAQHRDESRLPPVVALTALEHPLQRADAERQQDYSWIVDRVGPLLVLSVVHVGDGENRRDDAERNVDVEDPRPVVVVRDPAAERRAECRADHDADAEDRHAGSRFFGRERFVQRGLRRREQRPTANSLNYAPEDQPQQRVRRPAEEGREGEEKDRAREVALSAEVRRQPAGHRDDDDVGDDVRGRNPRDLVERRAQISHHVGDGDVYDRGVDQLEHRRHRDGGGNDVLVRVAVLGG